MEGIGRGGRDNTGGWGSRVVGSVSYGRIKVIKESLVYIAVPWLSFHANSITL